jgi:hypothetical protein
VDEEVEVEAEADIAAAGATDMAAEAKGNATKHSSSYYLLTG